MVIIIKIFVTFDTVWLDYNRASDILRQDDYTSACLYLVVQSCVVLDPGLCPHIHHP